MRDQKEILDEVYVLAQIVCIERDFWWFFLPDVIYRIIGFPIISIVLMKDKNQDWW